MKSNIFQRSHYNQFHINWYGRDYGQLFQNFWCPEYICIEQVILDYNCLKYSKIVSSNQAKKKKSRILAVADVYDSLVSDRPCRKAMSPFDAKEIIIKGSGTDFDPGVVEAFFKAFNKGEMEVPHLVV